MSDYFKTPNDDNNSSSEGDVSPMANFMLSQMGAVSADDYSASEKVEELIEDYEKLRKASPNVYPAKVFSITPEWLDNRELVIFYLQVAGKTAVSALLFDDRSCEEKMKGSDEIMVRAPAYNVTRMREFDKNNSKQSRSDFLKFVIDEMTERKLIESQTSWDDAHLTLAGCLLVEPSSKILNRVLISAATSEILSGAWALHGTTNFDVNEPDLNHKNYTKTSTIVDLAVESNATDIMGKAVFAPLRIRMMHYCNTKLSSGDGKRLTPKVEVDGYLEFRPLTDDELKLAATDHTKSTPLLIPQFVITNISNRAKAGVVTPAITLDAIAGVYKFGKNQFGRLYDQASQYSTLIDEKCTEYDFNYLGLMLLLEKAKTMAIAELQPADPIFLMTGQAVPDPRQKELALTHLFGPMEVVLDTPQSGESAKARQELVYNPDFYHQKLTGAIPSKTFEIRAAELIPHGQYNRQSIKSEEIRDSREVFNSIALLKRFHAGTSESESFLLGRQYTTGVPIKDDLSRDRSFVNNYQFQNDTLFADGSYTIDYEYQRVVFGIPYLEELDAAMLANDVSYELRNSGENQLNNLKVTPTRASSMGRYNLY